MKTAKSTTSKRTAPTVESYASVWDALTDTPEQAANLRARSELMRQITAIVKVYEITGVKPQIDNITDCAIGGIFIF